MPTAKDKLSEPFVQVPKWIVRDPRLNVYDKAVLAVMLDEDRRKGKGVFLSQYRIAERIQSDRETVRRTQKRLADFRLIIPRGVGKRGKQETYDMNVWDENAVTLPELGGTVASQLGGSRGELGGTSRKLDGGTAISKKQSKTKNKSAAGITANADATDKRNGKGFSAPVSAALSAGAASPEVSATLSKTLVNAARLTPEGQRVDDDPASVLCDLGPVLYIAGGEVIKSSVLDELIEVRGAAFCNLWRAWLLRKIAAQYAAGFPVPKPTGFYIKAVREGWEVDPRWPAFDEVLHTAAARAASRAEAEAELDALIPF